MKKATLKFDIIQPHQCTFLKTLFVSVDRIIISANKSNLTVYLMISMVLL